MSQPEAAAAPADPNALDRETMVIATVVLLGAIMSILDTTIVNVAIDRLSIDFNASLTTIQWVVTGYTLALAAVIPATGWAADRFGTKRIYLVSLALFMLGSALCAVAWSAGALIAFRVLQGIGGGMIMPAVMTIMTKKAGPHRMGRVMGILGVPMLIAPILGPILGGWLVDDVSWRWIFLINVPIGVVAIIAAWIKLEPDTADKAHRLDWLGMALLSPGLTLLIFGLAESADGGFGQLKSWAPILAGGALIVGFFWHSWRKGDGALIDIRTFTHTRAGASAGVFTLFAIAFFGALLLIPLYYQTVRGASALEAGLLLAPQGVGAMITMPLAGKLTDKYGPNRWPACGIPLLVIGLAPFAFVTATTSYWLLCSFSFVLGLGMGLSMMPTMTAAMQAVPPAAIARTSTAMNIIRQGGASIGTAVLSVILTAYITANLGHSGGLSSVREASPAQLDAARGPLADAFASTFVWALVMLGLAFIPALFMALGKWKTAAEIAAAEGTSPPERTPAVLE
ncbi:MAG TPA: DHA2 family efflux MFS transporter permease subunit [Solirubrobacterales bacterium]|nr:DHA2 family efflux MFS transporter permease subunit [Solirubrobacterales bacterium]